MDIYYVDIYTDLDETLMLTVNANSPQEADAIAISMVECGDAPCVRQIVVSYSACQ